MNNYSFQPGAVSSAGATETPLAAAFTARDLITDNDLNSSAVRLLLDLAGRMRKAPGEYSRALAGRTLALLFEKPSLRTRVTFEVAMKSMGGDSVFIDCRGERLGEREPVCDVARNLDRWVDVIAARVFRQSTVDELAHWASIPVINALSDQVHPCQALADMLTLVNIFGDLQGRKLAYVGDGNNVAHSLMLTGAKLGLDVAVATPPSYEPDLAVVSVATRTASETGAKITVGNDPEEAARGAHAIYTDVWTSMGSESEADDRRAKFSRYQINTALFKVADSKAVFMHCLPAHRGEEVDAETFESSRSVVFDQAENRLHAQKALLWLLLKQDVGKDSGIGHHQDSN